MTFSQRSGDTSHCQLFTNKTKNEIDLPNLNFHLINEHCEAF
jgi:hypothetical protein